MKKAAVTIGLSALLSIGSVQASQAQFLGNGVAIGEDRASFGLHVGLFAPMTTFHDDSFGASSFNNAGAIGVSGTFWPMLDQRLGINAQVVRSETEGYNETSDLAPIPANDPTQWLYSAELIGRMPMGVFAPYLSAGVGAKQYNWKRSVHDESRFMAWTGSLGAEFRPTALGGIGLTAELRGYHSKFRAFGIDDGTWEPGTRAREGTNIGFYGGLVGGVTNNDVLFSTGLSLSF